MKTHVKVNPSEELDNVDLYPHPPQPAPPHSFNGFFEFEEKLQEFTDSGTYRRRCCCCPYGPVYRFLRGLFLLVTTYMKYFTITLAVFVATVVNIRRNDTMEGILNDFFVAASLLALAFLFLDYSHIYFSSVRVPRMFDKKAYFPTAGPIPYAVIGSFVIHLITITILVILLDGEAEECQTFGTLCNQIMKIILPSNTTTTP